MAMASKEPPELEKETIDFDMVANPKSEFSNMYHIHKLSLYQQHYPPGFLKKVVAETIATFLLVFVTCGSAALSASDEHRVSKLGASLVGGLIVTAMIYAVGHISGAHMNPAVTLAFAAVRHFPWKQHVGTTSPSGTELQALVVEIVMTFSMMFITSAVATDTKAIGELAGIAVGSAVCITSIFAGPISGGSMNPARTLGPALASSYYKAIWVYLVGPVTGTLLGAWTYSFIRVTDKPIQAISPRSITLKLRIMKSDNVRQQIATHIDPLESADVS